MGSVYNRDVLLALVDLDLEGNGECVARSNVLCPGYSTRSWVVGAAVISGAINVGRVLWDDIGDGYIASSVGGVGVSYGVSKHLTSSYLVAVDGVALTVQDILLWLRQNYPNANEVSVFVVDDLGIVIVTDEHPRSIWSLYASNATKRLIRGNSGSVRNSSLLARKQIQDLLRKLPVRSAAYKLVGLLVQKLSGYLIGVSNVSVDNLCELVINVGAVCLYLAVGNSLVGNNKLLAAIYLGEQVILDVDRNLLAVNSNGIVSALSEGLAVKAYGKALEIKALVKGVNHAHRLNLADGINALLWQRKGAGIGNGFSGLSRSLLWINCLYWSWSNCLGVYAKKAAAGSRAGGLKRHTA